MNLYRILIVKDANGNAQAPATFEPNRGYYEVQLHGNAYVAADSFPTDYEDITSIENWHLHGDKVGKDYKWYRDRIKALVTTVGGGDVDAGFDTLTNTEKDICCYHKIGSQEQRVLHTSFSEVEAAGDSYNYRVSETRKQRASRAEGMIINYLPDDYKALFTTEGATIQAAWSAYRDFGVEGTLILDPPGISDWLFGSLALKSYTPANGVADCEALADLIWDCIHNGNY